MGAVFCHFHHPTAEEMLAAFVVALRPPERMAPSVFAARYRDLKEGTTERPGPWSNAVFPYLVSIMDCVQEAIDTGKRGVVLMKSGQGGGSEAMINVLAWLLYQYPGPILYLISKDDLAREFGRERFSHINRTCAPIKRKVITGRGSGELIQIKRYVDGKLAISGGRSVLNLQSLPYKFVFIDEVDSLLDEIEGHGDPVKLAEIRTDAFTGRTLIIAFAHPSTSERGAGKLYYDLSDQRRGFVTCPHCAGGFWFQWDHIRCTDTKRRLDPRAYSYFSPCCGAEISDAHRYAMARDTRQKSTLGLEAAKAKPWIGLHFSQLYMSNKPLAFLVEKWLEGEDDDSVRRVFVNKRLGDVHDAVVDRTTEDDWRALVAVPRDKDDPDAHTLGTVPSWVRLLTAGQDSRTTQLHWGVWGWGLLRNAEGYPELCAALVDCGIVERSHSPTLEPADLQVFNQILYDRSWPSVDGARQYWVGQGFHDAGWQPIAAYQYCSERPGRAVPCVGAAVDDSSSAPFLRWGASPKWIYLGREVTNPALRLALLNTYTLKVNWFGMVKKRFELQPAESILPGTTRPRIVLPRDVPEQFVAESSSEFQAVVKRKKIWKHRGPNHFSDVNIYAYAAALNLNPMQGSLPLEESIQQAKKKPKRSIRPVGNMGGWLDKER